MSGPSFDDLDGAERWRALPEGRLLWRRRDGRRFFVTGYDGTPLFWVDHMDPAAIVLGLKAPDFAPSWELQK